MAKTPIPSAVPTDPEQWSESSKRSYIYDSPPSEYKDYNYVCCRRKQPSVFTAEAQREAYEVRKAYIWQRRVLCSDCFRMCLQIESELEQCAAGWKSSRQLLQVDDQFLRRWLALLEDHVYYGNRADTGNIRMLRKLLRLRAA
jgi:hypothetical protein